MENKNQIKYYHDLTAFWLEKEWKTPREKLLEKELAQLRQQLEALMNNICCCDCGKPMTNNWEDFQDGLVKTFQKSRIVRHHDCTQR